MSAYNMASNSFHFAKAMSLSVVIDFTVYTASKFFRVSFTRLFSLFGRRASRKSFEYISTHKSKTQELCLEMTKSISQWPYEYRASIGRVSMNFLSGSVRYILFSLFLPLFDRFGSRTNISPAHFFN